MSVRASELFPSEKEFLAEVEFMSPGQFISLYGEADGQGPAAYQISWL